MKSLIIFISTAFISFGASAACNKPESPSLPDADTAVTAQMVKARHDVDQFLEDANAYLDCISNARQHDKMVDEMHHVGDSFNKIVRSYKARKSSASWNFTDISMGYTSSVGRW